jgi:hypothetical protein
VSDPSASASASCSVHVWFVYASTVKCFVCDAETTVSQTEATAAQILAATRGEATAAAFYEAVLDRNAVKTFSVDE